MPTLFISYKRGTSAVAPLMDELRKAHYRLWFDRDEIHLGDPDWQARIEQGLSLCDGVILNITPEACTSEPIQYEVNKALELGKPIFPVMLVKTDYDMAIKKLGLPDRQHIEEFFDVTKWHEQVERLLRDLRRQGMTVTKHDQRRDRDPNNDSYVYHQRYLKRVVDRVGMLDLASITPDGKRGIYLEDVYIDSPIDMSISVEVNNWQVVDWWLDIQRKVGDEELDKATIRYRPEDTVYEYAALESLIPQIDERIANYRTQYPDEKPDDEFLNTWSNGEHKNVIQLQIQHLAASSSRLVILGAPGSGKSTFVKHLALCLAGAGLDDWERNADLSHLSAWTHGTMTPVYVELRHFVSSEHFPQNIDTLPTQAHLWAYIKAQLQGDDLQVYERDLAYDLEHGHAVIILDGLDEVPYPEGQLTKRQAQLIHLAESIHTAYSGCRVIVASRPYAYEGWTLPGYVSTTITAFKDDHRIGLAGRLYQKTGLSEEQAQEKAKSLNQQLNNIDPELKDRPLFVTLMAMIYLQGDNDGLPTRRGALYRASILLLLERWTATKADMESLVDLLGDNSMDDLYKRLANLAYDVHHTYGEQQGTPEIDELLLYKHLKPLGRHTAADLIPYLSENAGVLVSPGQDDKRDVFHFAHRTFQEYLAAVHVCETCMTDDSFALLATHLSDKPQIWRVPGVLVSDVLADTDRRGDLWELIEDLLDDETFEDELEAESPLWWRVWLSATIAREQGLHDLDKLRRSERTVRDWLCELIIKLIETPQALAPIERADCGRVLALFDADDRDGVGMKHGLPDIEWCEIPTGTFTMGSDKAHDPDANDDEMPQYEENVPLFYMAKHPVTNVQYGVFIDAGGYQHREYWTEAGWEQKEKENWTEPRYWDYSTYNLPTQPVVGVSWYEAYAYTQWLNDVAIAGTRQALSLPENYEIRLAREAEWEKAARGTDSRIYPYGNTFDPTKANVRDTGIGQPSAVGIFPDGESPFGVLDMSGNVWEWCLTQWRRNYEIGEDNSVSGTNGRVLRGGAFLDNFFDARASYRYLDDPLGRNDYFGFRIVLSPILKAVDR